MNICQSIQQDIKPFNLLQHSFYQTWNAETLRVQQEGAIEGAKLWWSFLDGITSHTCLNS